MKNLISMRWPLYRKWAEFPLHAKNWFRCKLYYPTIILNEIRGHIDLIVWAKNGCIENERTFYEAAYLSIVVDVSNRRPFAELKYARIRNQVMCPRFMFRLNITLAIVNYLLSSK